MKSLYYNTRMILIAISLLLFIGNIFAQREFNLDFHREREPKLFESNQIVDTITYPLGDTITIIQRPLLNIPVIAIPGDTIKIECEADSTTTEWSAKLIHQSKQIELDITDVLYDPSLYHWMVSARVPRFTILKVYDVLGNEIATLVNEEKTTGNYEVEWNASGLPSGVYFYRLQSGSFVETKKMVLLK